MIVSKPNGVHTAVIRPMSLTRGIAPVQYGEIFQRVKTHCDRFQGDPGGVTPCEEPSRVHLPSAELVDSASDGHPRDRIYEDKKLLSSNVCSGYI